MSLWCVPSRPSDRGSAGIYNICDDDTSVYYIRVYRGAGVDPDCAEYSLRITNGVF